MSVGYRLLELAHEHSEQTRDIAETAVRLFDQYVRTPMRESDLPDAHHQERERNALLPNWHSG